MQTSPCLEHRLLLTPSRCLRSPLGYASELLTSRADLVDPGQCALVGLSRDVRPCSASARQTPLPELTQSSLSWGYSPAASPLVRADFVPSMSTKTQLLGQTVYTVSLRKLGDACRTKLQKMIKPLFTYPIA
ncbi:unnamed protein product [Protopolystoma xenopodis]|uniref:Uncharacterized protein n=1 Tax=Protopolystoma xenopodis TaxID=117903 RepID=A0A448XT81_9PLAT|nr:unnamed protein product [Protopolystoma xenopodis]